MDTSSSGRKTIAAWRLLRGDMTQQELAMRAGLHLSTVAVTESGATRPNSDTLRKIADALGVTMDQIELPPRRRKGVRDHTSASKSGASKRRGPKPRPRTPQAPQPQQTPDEADDPGDDPKAWARTAA